MKGAIATHLRKYGVTQMSRTSFPHKIVYRQLHSLKSAVTAHP